MELKSIKVDENNLRDIVNYAFMLSMWCYPHIKFFYLRFSIAWLITRPILLQFSPSPWKKGKEI